MQTVSELRQWGRGELAELAESGWLRPGGIALEVDVLLADVLGWSQAEVLARLQDPVGDNTRSIFSSHIARRKKHEPIAYITGRKEFFGIDFLVTSAVLIPRPETEFVVEQGIRIAKHLPRPFRVVDVGTGSGAIILSLLHSLRDKDETFLPELEALAFDISADALSVAKQNAERLNLSAQVRFEQSDLLSALPAADSLEELILANPPYVAEHEELAPDVMEFEPSSALFAGPDGLDIIFRLLEQVSARFSSRSGTLVMEIGHRQRLAVEFALNSISDVTGIEFIEDLQGISRVVVARFGELLP